MMRVVVLGQAGTFGNISCRRVASRLSRRLGLPCLAAAEALPDDRKPAGWIAKAEASVVPKALLRAADTVVWLHYSPAAVAGSWLRGLRSRLSRARFAGRAPRLSDVGDSLWHMISTPQLHQLLCQPEFTHLQIFCLRSPGQTDFWLRAQEHRLLGQRPVTMAQAA